MIGIYKITSPSKKVYIGQSTDIIKRWKQYKRTLGIKQTRLNRSFIKYGIEKHNFEIIQVCNIEQLNYLEKYYVDLFQSFNSKNGLNLRDGGGAKAKMSDETKFKISISSKGRKHSKESIKKMSILALNMSDEHKKNISLSKLGKKRSDEFKINMSIISKNMSDEVKLKISNSLKGRKLSEETRNKMSVYRTGKKRSQETIRKSALGNTGKKRTVEARLNMSLSHIGKKLPESTKINMRLAKAKIILNTDTFIYYIGADEAAIAHCIKKRSLVDMLRGVTKNKTSLIYV